ncbi:methylated-DNA--[protein]-cysteine S-methyltransferase [Compostibacter hankyongensis]|uniref:Methylated-DNA--protein-cysteine methyltransferase n=1 Tax=Compostibacter hankyongensis TaxID=1007089 RepID=A0ABP8FEA1_9BACT
MTLLHTPYYFFYQSPVGWIKLGASDTGLMLAYFMKAREEDDRPNAVTREALRQLEAYFEGRLKSFDLPLEMQGTDFQRSVWTELLKIPFGKTISYLALSQRLGDEKAIRAAARANGQNPLPVIVPCHRVIGSDGSLTGYSGGLWRKKWLLQHEGLLPQLELPL